MNLHRTGTEGQWEAVAPEDQNLAQRVAQRTNGIVTPGNAVSLAGAALVGSGLHDISKGKVTRGVLKIGAGRMADVGDGMAAETTGTKSPIGEAVDVIVDKAETAAALPVLVNADILPRPAAAAILGQNLVITAFSAVAKRRGIELHPSREGKLSMAGQWATIGFHGLSAVAHEADAPNLARGLEIAGHISTIATAALGAKAIFGYAQETFPRTPAVEGQANLPVEMTSLPESHA